MKVNNFRFAVAVTGLRKKANPFVVPVTPFAFRSPR